MIHDPELKLLANLLNDLLTLLNGFSEPHWEVEIAKCLEEIERSDRRGMDRLLSLFEGAGSLNNVLLQRNGVLQRDANARFQSLTIETWQLAKDLSRDKRNHNT